MILAIDTSLPVLSVALISTSGADHFGSVALEGRSSRNEKLLPAIDWLLTELGVSLAQLTLLAVTRGPGSFTGTRIGLATVQGLSISRELPVCAMSTHEAAASAGGGGVVMVSGDAGRGERFVSLFRGEEELIAPRLAWGEDLERVRSQAEAHLDLEELLATHNMALLTAHRAARVMAQGSLGRYRDTTPLYVRLAEAEVKLQQKAAGS